MFIRLYHLQMQEQVLQFTESQQYFDLDSALGDMWVASVSCVTNV